MAEPLSHAVRYLFPALFVLALLRDRLRARHGEGAVPFDSRFWAAGLILGGALVFLYAFFDVRTVVEGILMIGAGFLLLLVFVAGKGSWSRWGLRIGGVLLVSQRAAALGAYAGEKSLGRLNVLNSDFLLFAAGGVMGVLLCAIAFAAVSKVAPRVRGSPGGLVAGLSAATLAAEHFTWGYYSMVLHGWATVPEKLFGTLVYLVNHIDAFSTAQMALALVFSTAAYVRRKRVSREESAAVNPALRRKALWEARQEWHFGRAAILAIGLMAAVTFYYESYAGVPPRLTHATEVKADGGEIMIAVDSLKKEELRRYVYEDAHGRAIRFIVLKDETGSIRAGYDACLMCGSKGYVKNGKYLICLACGSAVYGPTVGRRGGCNPIPFPLRVENGRLVIQEQDLVQGEGARFFASSEVG
ncbi:MAG: DUF2318 domain-containing protein [Nitrospirae bacterium]|nr:DUF2318 domain-containing protein [Nitrospirota bacterium]